MSQIIIKEDEDKTMPAQETPEEQEEQQQRQEPIKARAQDAFEYRERTRESIKPDLPFSALIPEEYYEQREQEEKAKNEKLRKKEVGRMKMAALADAFRLIGNGVAVNKGAHEQKWEPNQQHQIAFKNLEKLTADEASALEKLKDLQLRQKEVDRNFNYRAGRDAAGDQERMMGTNEANQKYIDQLTRQDEREDYNRERQKKLDEQGAADRAADRDLRRQQIDVSRQRANRPTSGTPAHSRVQMSTGTHSYDFDLEDPNDTEAIALMLKGFTDNVANKELMEKWQAQNSPEWTALRDMLNPNKKWTRYGVSALMPHIFDPAVADSYQIRYINRPQAPAQEAPTTQQPQAPAPQAPAGQQAVQPQAPATNPGQWNDPSYGTWGGSRPVTSTAPPSPAQQVIQSIEEEKARKEGATTPANDHLEQERSIPVSFDEVAGYRNKDRTDLIKHKEWATLSRPDRTKKIFSHIHFTLGYEDGKYNPGKAGIQRNVSSTAEKLGEYYTYNDPQTAAAIELGAKHKGVSPQEFLETIVGYAIKHNISPDELIYNILGDE